jgi:regulator of replication initiation timing
MTYQFYDTVPSLEKKVHSLEQELEKEQRLFTSAVSRNAHVEEITDLRLEVENIERKIAYFRKALQKKQEEQNHRV